ncbi:MAG: HAD-IIB family hydrolase [Clostridia bacterium]|nr:HAD-IIB family hydrolase [Clostridia bacterium]
MTDFSRYIIATDLDGTFFGPGGVRVERNMEAVERFKAGGGLFTYATGRLHLNIRNVIGDSAALVNAPAVMCNGAYLYDFAAQRAREEEWMDPADVREILDFSQRRFPDVPYRVSTATELRIREASGFLAQDIKDFDPDAVRVAPVETWPVNDWYKIVYRELPERLSAVRAALMEHFGERLGLTSSGTNILEVQNPGCNKAKGLEKLRRFCGGDRILIACGDFENDIEMLQAADIAVCPENAMPGVKKIADHILCHCKEGLIADVIHRLEKGEWET